MTHQMLRQMDLVLTYVGTGAENRVVSRGDDWQWEVSVDGEFYIAYTGTLSGCLAMGRRYDAQPHIIETAHGPVCCN